MLLLRLVLLLFFGFTFGFITETKANLYGFKSYNPYTKEEQLSDLRYPPLSIDNYREEMRKTILMLINYAKEKKPDFKIIIHNDQQLLNKSLWEYSLDGYNLIRKQSNAKDDFFLFHDKYVDIEPQRNTLAHKYLNMIDAIVLNNIYCGTQKINPVAKNHNLDLISVEYCPDINALEEAQINSIIDKRSIYAFTDLENAFKTIGDYEHINDSARNIYQISDAQNILILNDDSLYKSQEEFTNDLSKTNYDIIIIHPLFAHNKRFSDENFRKLKFKKNGTKRLIIAEFNISEANPMEYYWQDNWRIGNPSWLIRPSFSSPNNIITQYWAPEWKKIIAKYFDDLLNEDFDGVFFTGVENYSYFEQRSPLE